LRKITDGDFVVIQLSLNPLQYGGDHLRSTDLARSIAHPEIKGFFGANEGSAIGVLDAGTELDMAGKLVVIGFDSGQRYNGGRDYLEPGGYRLQSSGSRCDGTSCRRIRAND
jgi:hypothetical protein